MWSLSEVVTAWLCVKENMSKPAELSTFKDVWSGQSGWRFGREMSLNVRLHNTLCSPIPTVGLAAPSENRVQMLYLTRGTEIHPQRGLWVTQLFLLKKGEPNGQNSDDVSHHRQYEDTIWSWRHVPWFEMWWDQRLKCQVLKGLFAVQVYCSYSCTWHLSLNEKTRYGRVVISVSALEAVHRWHHRDLTFWL